MARHGCRGDESALGETNKLLAIDRGALTLLAAPVLASGTSAEECAVQIGGHYFAVVLYFTVEGRALCPRDAGVSDEDVEAAIELLDDLIDGPLYRLPACYIYLVCLA